ncbi:bile acid:sodium symporter [Phytohabitans maris]|uniref:bile acid:sodium symporter n=1 Tax=Phytohabitans maris TaxID=3071409 RepID=UPI003D16E4B5
MHRAERDRAHLDRRRQRTGRHLQRLVLQRRRHRADPAAGQRDDERCRRRPPQPPRHSPTSRYGSCCRSSPANCYSQGSASGSTKSAAAGLPMATVLFSGTIASLLVLPLIIFHQLQLVTGTILARHWASKHQARPGDDPRPEAQPSPA